MWASLPLTYLFLTATAAEVDFKKCMELSRFGYGYDALFKLTSPSAVKGNEGKIRIDFFVKAASDAHILLASQPNVLESVNFQDFTGRNPKMVEICIGGGKNTFSAIRVIRVVGQPGTTLTHKTTPNILSDSEYRGFWIEIKPKESISLGLVNNDTAVLTAVIEDPLMVKITQISYFGVSQWNGIKGHWKINCPPEGESEVTGIEESSLTGLQKLVNDYMMYADTTIPSRNEDESPTKVFVHLEFHNFEVDERLAKIKAAGRIHLTWNDTRLQWAPEYYDNVTSTTVPAAELWTPDIVFFSTGAVFSPESWIDGQSAGVVVSSDGTMQWKPNFQMAVYCTLNANDWPKDEHECYVFLGFAYYVFYNYDYETIAREPTLPFVVLRKRNPKDKSREPAVVSKWNMIFSVHDDSGFFKTSFNFRRKSTAGFVSLMATPFIGVAIMGMSGLWLRPDNTAKLYLSCLCSVIYTLFITKLAEEVPPNVEGVPSVVIVYTWGLMMTCIAILHYVVSKNLNKCTWKLPYWVELLLTNNTFQTVFCLGSLESGLYNSLKAESESEASKDWLMITTAIERIIFIVYLCVYTSLYVRFVN